MRKKSIRRSTFWNLLIVMLLLTAVVHVSILIIYKNFYIGNCTKQIETDLQNVVEILENTDDYDAVLKAFVKNNQLNICFKVGNKTLYYHGDKNTYLETFSDEDALVQVSGLEGTEAVLFRTREVTLQNGEKAVVQLSLSMQQLREARKIAVSLLPYSLLISLLFSLFFSGVYSKKITRPILVMKESVQRMTELQEDACIQISNEDELGELADDINVLYSSLLKTIDDYKAKTDEVMHMESERLDFFRGASHELKTPLAKLSVITENMKYNIGKYKDHDQYLSESLVIIHELSRMISEILDGVKHMKEPGNCCSEISVSSVLLKTVDSYQLIARSKHKELRVRTNGDFRLSISEADLQKVLSNIISNAIKYGTENSDVLVEVKQEELSIYNEAEEIPEATMKSIWKGEYVLHRKADSKSSGLGLYIVKTILDGYRIRYCFTPYKKGYVFKIHADIKAD